MKNPITLVILDGYGLAEPGPGNAVSLAKKPNLDRIFSTNPCSKLEASGLAVGLPEGQMGNSEVGHTNIGAGRIVYQELTRIGKAIADGGFFENETLTAALDRCREGDHVLHLMGLLSDGGVHSHINHLFALLEMAARRGVAKVFVHCFLDGRDVSPVSGAGFLTQAAEKMKELGVGEIASVMGRYYAMDRDRRWDRVEAAYGAVAGLSGALCPDPAERVRASYGEDVTDEFVVPFRCVEGGGVRAGDSVVFFNFRPDRARELTRALADPEFRDFERPFLRPHFVCMTQYDAAMPGVHVAFPPQGLENILGEYLSGLGYTQLRIAETEKYAHVTFFFNGGREEPFPGEDRALIPSPKVATYDLKPEMSAFEVADEAVRRIESGKYDCIILNFANCDMVGHTGVIDAAVRAVEAVDVCVARVAEATKEAGGLTILTADHGNADKMLADDGKSPFTAHSLNPVPFCIVGAGVTLRDGRLCDIAPTLLDLMGLDRPGEMDGETLIC